MRRTPRPSESGSPPRPNLDDFRKEAAQKLTVWRNERKTMKYSTHRVDSPLSPKDEDF
ncbi:hypothetical protein I314_03627 [Cryptococcus bacillisporus CA1873]|uniref:Uncharacterized protein n=1 Tax=Cryptococcus bacillisporus CA1873 TaxID=1296111 RepID=A0ABR5B9S1_CRYGA|nr:hypothetical protein I314_03627 [Cryptococcus bacillisporus CA1873]|eukprot:KIR60336.1 hypothetical protein I314_03627 [Cryptococcus gattii CA1873]